MKFSKIFVVLLLSIPLTFCSLFQRGATPGDSGEGEGIDNGITDAFPPNSDAEVELDGKTEYPASILGFKARITDGTDTAIAGGEELAYNNPNYEKGFTVDASKANRYYRGGINGLTWSDVRVMIFNKQTGDKYISEVPGEYIRLEDDVKNKILCTGKKARVFVLFTYKNLPPAGGYGGDKDSYVEGPPITLVGTGSHC